MTDAALRHGLQINMEDKDSNCCKPQSANALFEMVDWWPVGEPQISISGRAINYLLTVGYDREKRNSEGLIPLLHAATGSLPQVIQCIQAFIRGGARVDTTDKSGRGALHCALGAPHCFTGRRTLRLTSYALKDVLNYFYVPIEYSAPKILYMKETMKMKALIWTRLHKLGRWRDPFVAGKSA